jgi:glycosyltransferase involved in cell wall biosynthesis
MKIAFLTHQFPGVRGGGIGTYVLQAARALAAAGHEPLIFTPILPGDSAKIRAELATARVQLVEVPDLAACVGTLPAPLAAAVESGGEAVYRVALGWLLCEAAREHHRRHRLDIVEAAEYESLGLPLMIRPEPGLPVVTHLHLCSAIARAGNLFAETAPTPEDDKIDAMEREAIRLADGICAPTRYIVQETERYLGIAASATVIPYPMKLAGRATPLPERGPVLFAGRLEPRKGSALMPGAFNEFLSRNPDATIRLVGSDTQFPGKTGRAESVRATITQALRPELRDRVIFTGEQSPEQVRAEFARCRFSIVPSLFDNFPNSAAESLAAGRPVIAGDSTGTVEVVGDAGLTFSRGDAGAFAAAMERLWRDRDVCRQLAEKAVARTTTLFSVENTVTARVDFYRQVAEKAAGNQVRSSRFSVSEATLVELLRAITRGNSATTAGTPGTRLLALMEKINPRGACVHLYGAGRHTSRLMAQRDVWESRGHKVVGLIDDHPRFQSSPIHLGLPVQSVQAAVATMNADAVVVLSTDTFEDQFWEQTAALRAKGVQVHRLYGKN